MKYEIVFFLLFVHGCSGMEKGKRLSKLNDQDKKKALTAVKELIAAQQRTSVELSAYLKKLNLSDQSKLQFINEQEYILIEVFQFELDKKFSVKNLNNLKNQLSEPQQSRQSTKKCCDCTEHFLNLFLCCFKCWCCCV